jgi:hypothetical protein
VSADNKGRIACRCMMRSTATCLRPRNVILCITSCSRAHWLLACAHCIAFMCGMLHCIIDARLQNHYLIAFEFREYTEGLTRLGKVSICRRYAEQRVLGGGQGRSRSGLVGDGGRQNVVGG